MNMNERDLIKELESVRQERDITPHNVAYIILLCLEAKQNGVTAQTFKETLQEVKENE